MPADSHQHRDAVTSSEIVDLLLAVLEPSADDIDLGPDTALADLDLDSDLVLIDLTDVMCEEYGERSLGAIDFDRLWAAKTISALALIFSEMWSGTDE